MNVMSIVSHNAASVLVEMEDVFDIYCIQLYNKWFSQDLSL